MYNYTSFQSIHRAQLRTPTIWFQPYQPYDSNIPAYAGRGITSPSPTAWPPPSSEFPTKTPNPLSNTQRVTAGDLAAAGEEVPVRFLSAVLGIRQLVPRVLQQLHSLRVVGVVNGYVARIRPQTDVSGVGYADTAPDTYPSRINRFFVKKIIK
jgi:hypothetical protein